MQEKKNESISIFRHITQASINQDIIYSIIIELKKNTYQKFNIKILGIFKNLNTFELIFFFFRNDKTIKLLPTFRQKYVKYNISLTFISFE